MKTVIKLVLMAILINATWRVTAAYYGHYAFVDAVRDLVQYGGRQEDAAIQEKVVALASKHSLPIAAENLTVKTTGPRTYVNGSYTRMIEPFPGFKQPWRFTIDVDAISSLTAR